ncbi:imidazole glycerol phosphate synthase subunit HisH [Portibacter lacus]|uniref:Imidazole glycerol phosphate synthase subunit HisH n=1 Tax=Portibacter lacus TaxID=1099794 RepID=A0AA37SNH2_9BACT|nr:imidazole glycerol phosphate synthase subunit HisH [Portibacter lacus]GLR16314.1 imidazole glycerol phosphate synthase subunit HisH [Portibacter lacus]
MSNVVIIDYGAGNVQSVKFALERLGVQAVQSADAEVIKSADKVIFPGVGEARSAMEVITKMGLDKVIPALEQPCLGICLGMQLMCSFSEERDTPCLDIFQEKVKKFNIQHKVPHMGWNTVSIKDSKLLKGIADNASFYFVHSYYVPVGKYTIGVSDYGHEFSAIMQKDNFYGCQFHPEKSAINGSKLIKNFLEL